MRRRGTNGQEAPDGKEGIFMKALRRGASLSAVGLLMSG